MSHTPGPWHAICDKRNAANRMAMVQARGTLAIDCTKSGKSHKEDCANARLIAAAPDLLEALKHIRRCVRFQESMNANVVVIHGPSSTLKQIDDAIAKAEP